MAVNPEKIGVGIIGASPDRGWASVAHIPALRSLPDYEIRALSTSRRESAEKAAVVFGVSAAFDNAEELIVHPGVDLVVVTVKVPYHRDLVCAALNAGKMVYSEWPLGNGLAEAEEMAILAQTRGVKTIVGLQARLSPAVKHIYKLVRDGYVGDVLSTSIIASGIVGGATTDPSGTYLYDEANGANLLTIPFGHTVDALCWILGEFQEPELKVTTAVRRPQVTVSGTGEVIRKNTPDQIVVSGILESGAVASIHYRGGTSSGTNFLWEINGTAGDIVVTGPSGHLQMIEVEVRGRTGSEMTLSPISIPESEAVAPSAPTGSPFNVAQMYAQFAVDIREGTQTTPNFTAAVRRHRMISAVQKAAGRSS